MIKRKKIPTIIGIIVLVLGTFLGTFLLNSKQIFRLGAAGENAPKDIRVSNIDDSSFTVNFVTDKEVSSFLIYGNKISDKSLKSLTHSITINNLKANQIYFYKINSGGTIFDNGGIPWQIKLGPDIGSSTFNSLASGSVLTASGTPVNHAIIYANIKGYLLSTLTSETGNFVFQLGTARTSDLESYQIINPNETLIELSVQAGGGQVSSAQVYPKSANPIPPIIIGQTQDFRNLDGNSGGSSPNANLALPTDNPQESRFNVPDVGTPIPATTVILENIDNGETITSTQPEFMGKGPAGIVINILLESENPINSSVSVPNNGSWSWSPPTNLTPGPHTITLSWKDISGITRSLKRTFIVQAAELPSFEASESGTFLTPTPIASPKPTAKAGSPTPTPKPIPETGSLTPTFLLSIMGVVVLLLSLTIWKIAEN